VAEQLKRKENNTTQHIRSNMATAAVAAAETTSQRLAVDPGVSADVVSA